MELTMALSLSHLYEHYRYNLNEARSAYCAAVSSGYTAPVVPV